MPPEGFAPSRLVAPGSEPGASAVPPRRQVIPPEGIAPSSPASRASVLSPERQGSVPFRSRSRSRSRSRRFFLGNGNGNVNGNGNGSRSDADGGIRTRGLEDGALAF